MMADRYASFAELAAGEAEGETYAIRLVGRRSGAAIIAPHGGWIEPTTSEIATAIAASVHSLYCFEGIGPSRPHHELHITSHRFDEPIALAVAAASKLVVTIHGYFGSPSDTAILLGGHDTALRDHIADALRVAGFAALTEGHRFPATHPRNICNRSSRGRGVQLELSRALRDRLATDPIALDRLGLAVRSAIAGHLDAV